MLGLFWFDDKQTYRDDAHIYFNSKLASTDCRAFSTALIDLLLKIDVVLTTNCNVLSRMVYSKGNRRRRLHAQPLPHHDDDDIQQEDHATKEKRKDRHIPINPLSAAIVVLLGCLLGVGVLLLGRILRGGGNFQHDTIFAGALNSIATDSANTNNDNININNNNIRGMTPAQSPLVATESAEIIMRNNNIPAKAAPAPTTKIPNMYYTRPENPKCISSRVRHPLELSPEEQKLEYGFTLANYRMTNESNFFVSPVYEKLKKTQLALDVARDMDDNSKCVQARVPRKLHWVWLGEALPEKYTHYIYLCAVMNPGWDIFLWGEAYPKDLAVKLESIYAKFHFKNVTEMMEKKAFARTNMILNQKNLAGKSDYIRLEAVFLEGGIYQDTDARVVRSFDSAGNLFRWPFVSWTSKNWRNCPNAVFGFEPKSKFLDFAIKLARENCLTFQTCNPPNGAGPPFFSAAVALYNSSELVFIESGYTVTKEFPREMISYQNSDANWIAQNKGEIPSFKGVNCNKEKQRANTCKECPGEEQGCGGECQWNKGAKTCELAVSFGR